MIKCDHAEVKFGYTEEDAKYVCYVDDDPVKCPFEFHTNCRFFERDVL